MCSSDLLPCQMGEVGINGAPDDLTVNLAELLCPITEGNDLSGANEGKVQGVEEEDHILP